MKSLSQYCHEKISKSNFQEVVAIYDTCLSEVNGLTVINRLNKKMVKLDQSNTDRIKGMVAQLSPNCIADMKRRVMGAIERNETSNKMAKNEKSNAMAEIDFLLQDKQHVAWCETQIEGWITNKINNQDFKTASELVHKYLWNKPDAGTHTKAMQYVHKMIEININGTSTAFDLIDQFLWNNPETQPQALDYVMRMLDRSIKNNDTMDAMQLIDKYLWVNPNKEMRQEVLSCVDKLIKGSISKGVVREVVELIDKYITNNHIGISYYFELINFSPLKDKASVYKLIPKVQLLVKSYIDVPNLTDDHRRVVREYVAVLTSTQSDFQIITLLSFIKEKFKDQEIVFVNELANVFVQGMQSIDPQRAKKVQDMFLS